MRVKVFVRGGWARPAEQFAALESEINAWLEAHPDIEVEHTDSISQPTFGWGQLALAIWYREHGEL